MQGGGTTPAFTAARAAHGCATIVRELLVSDDGAVAASVSDVAFATKGDAAAFLATLPDGVTGVRSIAGTPTGAHPTRSDLDVRTAMPAVTDCTGPDGRYLVCVRAVPAVASGPAVAVKAVAALARTAAFSGVDPIDARLF